jgi:hypothetical protein
MREYLNKRTVNQFLLCKERGEREEGREKRDMMVRHSAKKCNESRDRGMDCCCRKFCACVKFGLLTKLKIYVFSK